MEKYVKFFLNILVKFEEEIDKKYDNIIEIPGKTINNGTWFYVTFNVSPESCKTCTHSNMVHICQLS